MGWSSDGAQQAYWPLASLNALIESEGFGILNPAVVPLYRRPFWNRVWIVQEFSIPSRLKLLCGSKELDMIIFRVAVDFVDLASAKISRLAMFFDDARNSTQMSQIQYMAQELSMSAFQTLLSARQSYQFEAAKSLAILLYETCTSATPLKASDARDRVYGLLAVSSDHLSLCVFPDYEKGTAEMYTDVTRKLIAHGQLSILTWSQLAVPRYKLPSWVPDFASKFKEGVPRGFGSAVIYDVSRNIPFPGTSVTADAKNPSLDVRSTRVGTISTLGTTLNFPFPLSFSPDYTNAQLFVSEIESFCQRSPLYKDDSKFLDASARIPWADKEVRGATLHRGSNFLRGQYDAFKRIRANDDYEGSIMKVGYLKPLVFQHGRRPFISKDGHVGLAPAEAQPGDLICIVYGLNVPLILRHVTNGTYQLVGEAYVYGIMDGEWFDEDRESTTFALV